MKLIHYKILTIVLIILLVGSVVLLFQDAGFNSTKKIPADEAGKKAVSYINDSQGKGTASLVSAKEDKEKGLYKLELNVNSQIFESYITLDGSTLFPDSINLGTAASETKTSANPPAGETVDGDFIKVANQEIIKENGKPIIYFFGSTSCSHCLWEHPIIQAVAAKFGDKISFHDIMITSANDMKDKDIFSKYSKGGIPTIVLGGVYYREGSGEQLGEQKEAEVLTNLIQQIIDQK
ncbi:MAG: thioredoxin family protein [bacterium]|nr:thioredoxin family protein [bacterium]